MLVQKPNVHESHSKVAEFGTYDHITSQMVTSSNSLGSYYYRRTQHMINSYTYSFHIAEYKLSAYPEESDLLSWSIHQSEGVVQPFPELSNKLVSSIGHNSLGTP
jgi:hypothetical protein